MSPSTPTNTRDLVHQAADELLKSGRRPTVANVRAAIGRGSDSTITDELQNWWSKLAERLRHMDSLPPFPKELAEPVSGLWDAAVAKAGEVFAEQRQDIENRVDAANAEREATLAKLEQAEGALEVENAQRLLAERRIDEERALREETEDTLNESRAEFGELARSLAGKTGEIEQLTLQLNAERDAREADTQHWTGRLADEKQRTEYAQNETREAQKLLSALHERLEATLRQSLKHEKSLALARQEHERAAQALDESEGRQRKLEKDQASAQREYTRALEDIKASHADETGELRVEIAVANAELTASRENTDKLRAQVNSGLQEQGRLRQLLDAAGQQIERLQCDLDERNGGR